MSSALKETSSASGAILRIDSSGELYALSGIPWNSREFFLRNSRELSLQSKAGSKHPCRSLEVVETLVQSVFSCKMDYER